MIKKIIWISLLGLIAIQFVRPTKNRGNETSNNDISQVIELPDNMKSILKVSCYDCHSNHTQYPWYSEIMPLGWWLNDHVKEGKEELNFSEFAKYKPKKMSHKLEGIGEEVADHEMPLSSYLWLHPEAKLDDDQIKQIKDWVEKARLVFPAQD